MPPQTLYEKIWDAHVVHEEPGQPSLLYIDRHLIHEGTSPQAFTGLKAAGRAVRRPDLTFAVMDHSVPTKNRHLPILDDTARLQFEALARNCRETGVRLFDMHSRNQGIVHIIGPELGITQPGLTIVCGDSHTSTHGAFGALAFGILFFFIWKWVLPRVSALLDERREKIQGELENAEQTRRTADQELAGYREQLAGAREESNRIIEEARKTADHLRREIQAKAEEEASATVARAQDEIRAERDRVFEELRAQVGEIAVDLAGRVVMRSLDKSAHEQLIDEYIDQVAAGGDGKG